MAPLPYTPSTSSAAAKPTTAQPGTQQSPMGASTPSQPTTKPKTPVASQTVPPTPPSQSATATIVDSQNDDSQYGSPLERQEVMAKLYSIFIHKWQPMITECQDNHTFSASTTMGQVHENLPEGKTSHSMSYDMSDYGMIIWILLFHTSRFQTVGMQHFCLRMEFTQSCGRIHIHIIAVTLAVCPLF